MSLVDHAVVFILPSFSSQHKYIYNWQVAYHHYYTYGYSYSTGKKTCWLKQKFCLFYVQSSLICLMHLLLQLTGTCWLAFRDGFAVNPNEVLMTRIQKMTLDYHFKVEQEAGSSIFGFFGFNGITENSLFQNSILVILWD